MTKTDVQNNFQKFSFMKSLLSFISMIFLLIVLPVSCCDWEQPVPLPTAGKPTSGRVVLVEDFTGTSCPNCPSGNAAVESMLEKYPDNTVAIAVHSNFLAQPAVTGEPRLNHAEAEAIEKLLGAWDAKPEAAINRTIFSGQPKIRIAKPDTWLQFMEQELQKKPAVDISIEKNYNSATRELSMKVKVVAKEAINEAVHVHAMITESHIILSQKDQTQGTISGYEHNHVLRKVLSPIPGEKIADNMVAGQSIERSFTYTLPTHAQLWVDSNCSLVAFASQNETKLYILQAAETKLK